MFGSSKINLPIFLCAILSKFGSGLETILTIPIIVVSCKISFYKLKVIKNYFRLSLPQEKLSNMAILSTENKISKEIHFENIGEFASIKARKAQL